MMPIHNCISFFCILKSLLSLCTLKCNLPVCFSLSHPWPWHYLRIPTTYFVYRNIMLLKFNIWRFRWTFFLCVCVCVASNPVEAPNHKFTVLPHKNHYRRNYTKLCYTWFTDKWPNFHQLSLVFAGYKVFPPKRLGFWSTATTLVRILLNPRARTVLVYKRSTPLKVVLRILCKIFQITCFKYLTTILRVFIVEIWSICSTVLVDCKPIDWTFPVIRNVKAV